ncbi:MAG: BolA/IbaG family iron-sulfur metabolism protein [Pseudomonadota bacterium]
MNAKIVEDLVRADIEGALVSVEGAGANYNITVVSDLFDGMRAVKKQQTVYSALKESIASGDIHAVNIRTFTPEEWSQRAEREEGEEGLEG